MSRFKATAIALVGTLGIFGAVATATSASAATSIKASSVSGTTEILTNPDSGSAGDNWGFDGTTSNPLYRTLTVTPGTDCGTSPDEGLSCYDATISDAGGGITNPNQLTPNQAGSYAGLTENSPAVDYAMSGEASYNFWASESPSAPNIPSYHNFHYSDPSSTSEFNTNNWYELAFPSGTDFALNEGEGIQNNWSWSYNTCHGNGEAWVDAADNGDGGAIGDGNIQGLPCPAPVKTYDTVTLAYYCGLNAKGGFQFKATLTGSYEAKVNFVSLKDASVKWDGSYFIHPDHTDVIASGSGRYGLGAYWDKDGTQPAPHEVGALYTHAGAPSAASGERVACK